MHPYPANSEYESVLVFSERSREVSCFNRKQGTLAECHICYFQCSQREKGRRASPPPTNGSSPPPAPSSPLPSPCLIASLAGLPSTQSRRRSPHPSTQSRWPAPHRNHGLNILVFKCGSHEILSMDHVPYQNDLAA
jgi:hypothetical protein